MPRISTVYDILIASPNDVTEERKTVRDTIYQWNAINSRKLNAILEPVIWETHSRSEMGDRAQELLNKQIVEACDVLIALFWTRLGKPTGSEPSGTVEEIKKFLDAGKPVIVYFSTKPVGRANISDPNISDQIKLVDDYKKSLRDKGICFDFSSVDELNRLLTKDISLTIFSLLKRYELSPSSEDVQEYKENTIKGIYDNLTNFYQKFDVEWNDLYFSSFDKPSFRNQPIEDAHRLHPVLDWAYEELWKIHGDLNQDEFLHIQTLIKAALLKIKKIKDITDSDEKINMVGFLIATLKHDPNYFPTRRSEIFALIESSIREIKKLM